MKLCTGGLRIAEMCCALVYDSCEFGAMFSGSRSRIMKIPGGYRAIKKTGIVHPSISFSLNSISLSLPLLSVFLSLALSLTTARGFTLVDAQK